MPRAPYAKALVAIHTECGTQISNSYGIKSATCSKCGKSVPSDEWMIPAMGNESMTHVRAIEKENYELAEKERIREEIRKETKANTARPSSNGMAGDGTEEYATSGSERYQSGFEQGAQENFDAGGEFEYGDYGGKNSANSPDTNILVQILYNAHDLAAAQIDEAYSLRNIPNEQEFKEVIVEVSDELGMNVKLSPTQKFAFMYAGILLQMRKNAGDVEQEYTDEYKVEEDDSPLNESYKEGGSVWK